MKLRFPLIAAAAVALVGCAANASSDTRAFADTSAASSDVVPLRISENVKLFGAPVGKHDRRICDDARTSARAPSADGVHKLTLR